MNELPLFWWILTNLVSAGIGAAGAYLYVFRVAGRKPEVPHIPHPHLHHEKDEDEAVTDSDGRQDHPRKQPRTRTLVDAGSWYAIVLIVASLVVAAIGVQSYVAREQDQKAAAEQRKEDAAQRQCFGLVAQQLTNVLDVRSSANKVLEAAQLRRDNAVDDIIAVVVRGQEVPPPPVEQLEKEFAAALAAFKVAKEHLTDTRREVARIRQAAQTPDVSVCGPLPRVDPSEELDPSKGASE